MFNILTVKTGVKWVLKINLNDGLFYCPKLCGRKYKSTHAVRTHLKYECGIEPQFQCNICGKKFKQPVHHRTHILSVHKVLLH